MKNFDACLKLLLVHEGGNDDDPQDPGGRTSRGILQTEYDRHRDLAHEPRRDVWSATDNEVRTIYLFDYWNVMRCDELPAGLDYCVFDYGVNSSVSRSVKLLQKIWEVTEDGVIGPETLKATPLTSARGTIEEMCDARLAFLQSLKTWPRFGNGWSKRVADVRAAAMDMANRVPVTAAPGPTTPTGGLLSILLAAIKWFFARPPVPAKPQPPAKSDVPLWMRAAITEVGFHEVGFNQGIERYIRLARCGSLGDPWCAIFVNAMLEGTGVDGTGSAMARSFETSLKFVKLAGPAYGAITTMWRGSPGSGTGHVFFYTGESERGVLALGGNQSDQVCRQYEPRNRVVGYWWPKSVPLPKIGPITTDFTANQGTET